MASRPKRAAAPTSFKAPAYDDGSSSDGDASSDDGDARSDGESESDYEAPAEEGEDGEDDESCSDADFRGLEDEVDDGDVAQSDEEDDDASLCEEDGDDETDEGDLSAVELAQLLEDALAVREEYTTTMALLVNNGALGSPSAVYKSACTLRTLARAGALRDLLVDAAAEFASKPEDVRNKFLNHMLGRKDALHALLTRCNDELGRRGRRLLALDVPDTAEAWIYHLARTMPDAKSAQVARELQALPPDVVRAALGASSDDAVTLKACEEQFDALLRADPEKDAVFVVRNVVGVAHTSVAAWLESGALSWDDVAQMRKALRTSVGSRASGITRIGRKLRNDPPASGYVVVKFGADLPKPTGYVLVVEHMKEEMLHASQGALYDALQASEFPEVRDVVQKIVTSGLDEMVKRNRFWFEFISTEAAAEYKVKFVMRCGGDDKACINKVIKAQNVVSYLERNKALVCDSIQYKTSASLKGAESDHGVVTDKTLACALTDYRNKKSGGQPVTEAMRRTRKELFYDKVVSKVKRHLWRAAKDVTLVVRTAPVPPRSKPTTKKARLSS